METTPDTSQIGIMRASRKKKTEFIDNLREHNPNYADFEDGLIADIAENPKGIFYVALAGESATGKGEFARQVSIHLNQSDELRQVLGPKRLKHLHAAIGRTQNDLATSSRVGIFGDGVVPRGSIKRPQYTDASELSARMSSLSLRTVEGPAIYWDDSVWITALKNKRGEIIGEERGSIRWLNYALTQLKGRAVIFETEPSIQQEELNRREQLRSSSPDQAPIIYGQDGIRLEKGAEMDAKETAEKSGTHKSLEHTRQTLTLMMHRYIESGDLRLREFKGLTLGEFRTRLSINSEDWMQVLRAWDVLWAKRVVGVDELSVDVPARIYIFRNFRYPKGISRHRYKGNLIKVEEALAEETTKSQSRIFREEVESLGITVYLQD